MAKKQEQNLLKTSQIKKLAKETEKMEIYEFEDGTVLKFYPRFPETKIVELIQELAMIINQANEKGVKLTNEMVYYLILLQCIKHFTHLKKDIKADLEFQLDYYEALLNSGYFKKIIDEVFLPEEINKVLERVSDVTGLYQAVEKVMVSAQEKAQQLLDRTKVLNKIDELDKLVEKS